MEAAMEEALFGAQIPLSPIILSLEYEVDFKAAREALEIYYLAHKSKLSAAYCINGRIQGDRTVKVVSGDNLELEISKFQDATALLYAVAPSNATDEVVLSGLAQRKTEMVLGLTNEQLTKTGRILNPLHTKSKIVRAEVAIAECSTEKSGEKLAERAIEKPTEPLAGKNAQSPISNPTSTTLSSKSFEPEPANGDARSNARPSSKPGGLSSFFTKGTREDAVNFTKRDSPLKPVSSVVEATDYDQEDELPLEPSAKRQQLEKLKGMFDPSEKLPNTEMSDEEEEEQDIDVVGEPDVVTEHEVIEIEDSDMEAQEEQETVCPAHRESVEPEPVATKDQEPAEELDGALVVEPEEMDQASRVPPAEPIETELEDGWSVTEFAAVPEKPKSKKPATKAAAKSKGAGAQASLNLPKIPSKPQKKQPTLTSFFKKRG